MYTLGFEQVQNMDARAFTDNGTLQNHQDHQHSITRTIFPCPAIYLKGCFLVLMEFWWQDASILLHYRKCMLKKVHHSHT